MDLSTQGDETINSPNLPDMANDNCDKKLSKEPLLARIISNLLHPLFMAVYGVALLFLYTDFSYLFGNQFFLFMLPILILTCVIPATSIFVLIQLGVVEDYQLKDRTERTLPFVIALIAYGLLFYYFHKANFYIWFQAMLVAPMLILVIAAIVNKFWKISAHMMGIGCLIGSVLSISYNIKGINPYLLFIILFILAGALGVSRLALKRHTPAQVYVGFLVGLFISYACVWVGANFALIYMFFKFNF